MNKQIERNCLNCENNKILFGVLNDNEIKTINDNKTNVTFIKGETIVKQGTEISHIACIRTGLAKVYVEGLNGRNLIIR